jgi:hypothetical protein
MTCFHRWHPENQNWSSAGPSKISCNVTNESGNLFLTSHIQFAQCYMSISWSDHLMNTKRTVRYNPMRDEINLRSKSNQEEICKHNGAAC